MQYKLLKMKNSIIILLLAVVFIFSGCNKRLETKSDTTTLEEVLKEEAKIKQDLRVANDSLYSALNAMFKGNLDPMNALWLHSDNITDMGPFGGRLTGWDSVRAEFKKEAAMKFDGKIICKDLHVYAGTNMGYTVCNEVGENMSADGKPVSVSHRATNIFQLIGGQWKLVHHQTDFSVNLENAVDPSAKK